MTATTPEEVYPPRGYVLLGVHSDELFSTTIYLNREEALTAARAVSDGWAPAIAPIGKGARTSWDEPPNPEPPKLVWVPDGEGFYARDSLNRGTYRVTRVTHDSSGLWEGRYQPDDGETALCEFGFGPGPAKDAAQRHAEANRRQQAWVDYMRDNDPPAVI